MRPARWCRGMEKKELMCRARMTATRERGGVVHKPEEKAPFGKYTKASRAGWAEQGSDGLWGRAGWHMQTWPGRAGP
jgi:hypothetical protein